ncbi:MAG: LacI family DNA-binding transcriptional regulator [Anaerolineae bacterium]|nr:LacI family DNA-binding transcriptional regulator [Anaerolineae bacterium]
MTLRDVADRAQVSVTTVSNVVRGWPYIAAETRSRVEDAIEVLGYSPHSIAQGLRTGRTQAIGLVVPDLASQYFAVMVETVETVAQQRGYNVFVVNSRNSPELEIQAVEQVTSRWVDGLLIVQSTRSANTSKHLSRMPIPVVAMERVPQDYQGASCMIDNQAIVRMAVGHLRDLGHRAIAMLVAPRDITVVEARVQAFLSLTQGHGTLIPTADDFGLHGGYTAVKRLLDSGSALPTGIFASNDLMALGAMRAFSEHGIRVPKDVSIVGVDDIPYCAYLTPSLTTVRQPLELLASAGITMLLSLIDEKPPGAQQIVLLPELIVRESTGAPRKSKR